MCSKEITEGEKITSDIETDKIHCKGWELFWEISSIGL